MNALYKPSKYGRFIQLIPQVLPPGHPHPKPCQDDMPFVQEIQADPGFFNQVQAPEDRLPINIEIAIETGSLIVDLPTHRIS